MSITLEFIKLSQEFVQLVVEIPLSPPGVGQKATREVFGNMGDFVNQNFILLGLGKRVELFGQYLDDVGRGLPQCLLPDPGETPNPRQSPAVGSLAPETKNPGRSYPGYIQPLDQENYSLFDIRGIKPLDLRAGFPTRLCIPRHLLLPPNRLSALQPLPFLPNPSARVRFELSLHPAQTSPLLPEQILPCLPWKGTL